MKQEADTIQIQGIREDGGVIAREAAKGAISAVGSSFLEHRRRVIDERKEARAGEPQEPGDDLQLGRIRHVLRRMKDAASQTVGDEAAVFRGIGDSNIPSDFGKGVLGGIAKGIGIVLSDKVDGKVPPQKSKTPRTDW